MKSVAACGEGGLLDLLLSPRLQARERVRAEGGVKIQGTFIASEYSGSAINSLFNLDARSFFEVDGQIDIMSMWSTGIRLLDSCGMLVNEVSCRSKVIVYGTMAYVLPEGFRDACSMSLMNT